MEYLNSMYYTLSTIAQVLAAFIALSGVFILFKLDTFNKLQMKHARALIAILKTTPVDNNHKFDYFAKPTGVIQTLIDLETHVGLTKQFKIILENETTKTLKLYPVIAATGEIVFNIDKARRKIKAVTIISVIIGVIAIIYSIIILSIAHTICQSVSQLFIEIDALLAAISIATMTYCLVYSLIDYKVVATSNVQKSKGILSRILKSKSKKSIAK